MEKYNFNLFWKLESSKWWKHIILQVQAVRMHPHRKIEDLLHAVMDWIEIIIIAIRMMCIQSNNGGKYKGLRFCGHILLQNTSFHLRPLMKHRHLKVMFTLFNILPTVFLHIAPGYGHSADSHWGVRSDMGGWESDI